MPVIFQSRIEEADLDLNPSVLYVFGDNNLRRGRGGLAMVCRGKSNAVGVRTKRTPTKERFAFLSDEQLEKNKEWINENMEPEIQHLFAGGIVVFPVAPLGSGLADLAHKAPKTFQYIRELVERLADRYG